jgi:segregation and condensation protein B
MNDSYVRNVIEAALLAAGGPLPVAELVRLFEEGVRPSAPAVRAALAALEAEYAGRGIELKETASGFRIQVRRELAPEISRLWPERAPRYSRALLETLALIAYRQPITRAEIEAVRGVAVNPNIIRTVLERNWVRVVGHRDVAGHPELLCTTREFLDYFGLKSLDELPPLAELKAVGDFHLQLALPAEGTAAEGVVADSAGADSAGPRGAGAVSAGEAAGVADDALSAPDEASEDDELSAEGGGSAEMVAAPPDLER